MSHGQPDFGAYAAKQTVGSVADNAELAARLGSIVTFDRRGDVVWLDNFEENINLWDLTPVGIGSSIVLSDTMVKNGSRSGKLTTGNLIGNRAQIDSRQSYPVLSRIGFEISFTYTPDILQYDFYLYLYSGTQRILGRISYTDLDTTLLLYDNALMTAVDTARPLYAATSMFHTLKVVIDPIAASYVRLILDNVEYDVTAYALLVAADPVTAAHLNAMFRVYTAVNANVSIYADGAIITQNEP